METVHVRSAPVGTRPRITRGLPQPNSNTRSNVLVLAVRIGPLIHMVHDVDMARPLNLVLTGYMARIAELVLTLMVARTTSLVLVIAMA